MHRSRLCHFVIDVSDLGQGIAFWSAALGTIEETLPVNSQPVYRQLRLSDSDIRILLQKTADPKTSKERMHLDLETDDLDAEVKRLEALGASRWDHQHERGFEFWVMRDPWDNEVLCAQHGVPRTPVSARTMAQRAGRAHRAWLHLILDTLARFSPH